MRKGYLISNVLKELDSVDKPRLAKAMYLGNALAYQVVLDPALPVEVLITEALTEAKKVISSVNESTPIDTALCISLFKQTIRIRFELMNSMVSTDIMKMAVTSMVAEEHQTKEETLTALMLADLPNFAGSQQQIASLLSTNV